jgi:hypothetical protein
MLPLAPFASKQIIRRGSKKISLVFFFLYDCCKRRGKEGAFIMIRLEKQNFSVKIIPFCTASVLSLIILILTLVSPAKQYEDSPESVSMPALTVEAMANRSFSQKFESYLTRKFPGYPLGKKSANSLKRFTGEKELDGIFALKEKLIENVTMANPVTGQKNLEAVLNYSSAEHGFGINCLFGLIPTASEIYKEELPSSPDILDQTQLIAQCYERFPRKEVVDISTSLMSRKTDQIFYRTDSHWSSLGSYLGYQTVIKALGGLPYSEDMFNIEYVSHNFYGSLSDKTFLQYMSPDTIDLYHYVNGQKVASVNKIFGRSQIVSADFYDREKNNSYGIFLGDECGITQLFTTVGNGKKLLVFGDSYSYSMMQFLSLHYEEIVLVNLKYLTWEQSQLIDTKSYPDQLILYSVDEFINDNNISTKLSYFTQK